ncbi:Na+/H+ antiporter NhaC [Bacillus sp. MUM 116]|uniref:Na+/H+ antiporter NhaC n=1 Tax=Bacillus sp. MUM 116 TaxID=1678002 RepID=UPI0008F5EED1|nr:Na+/H+ antiporter NhaC [Bacillus sp. MUM 116]OIK12973.1 Na+/H+ antiporter NhaC [Bacillus sp. MUM 116]
MGNKPENQGNATAEWEIKSYKFPVSFKYAAVSVLIFFGLLLTGTLGFGASLELMFLLLWIVVSLLVMKLGYKYNEVQNMAWEMGKQSFEPNTIILVVGVMIATWMASGTIPYVMYWGLELISPQYFLITALILTSATSLATGTSWGTLGTAGLALMTVGNALGVPQAMTAGAIICGSFFGDKLSPLSDSTILAATVAGSKVMSHVKHMLWSTVPAYILTAIIFIILGLKYGKDGAKIQEIQQITGVISKHFHLSWISLIPLLVVLVMLVRGIPAIVSLLMGVFSGMAVAVFIQGYNLTKMFDIMTNGFVFQSGSKLVDPILSRGGLYSLMSSFLVVLLAMCVTGMLEQSGILSALVEPLVKRTHGSTFRITLATMVIALITNMIGSSMLLTAIVAGSLMKNVFKNNNLAPENLSRNIEDVGTMGAPVIPWNSNAIYCSQMLGVSPYAYFPYVFLAFFVPLFDLIYGATGFAIKKLKQEKLEDVETTSKAI